MDTHYLDLRIGIDSIELVKEGNIEGAKVALGVSEDTKVLSEFCNMLVEKIGASISKFSNVSIVNGNLTLAQQPEPETPTQSYAEDIIEPQYDEPSTSDHEAEFVTMDEEIPLIPDSQGGEESYIDEATGKLLVKSFDTVFDVRNKAVTLLNSSLKTIFTILAFLKENLT